MLKNINPEILRQFWSMIEQTQTQELLQLSDQQLTTRLQHSCLEYHYLSAVEISLLSEYIQTRIPLIRDLAVFCCQN